MQRGVAHASSPPRRVFECLARECPRLFVETDVIDVTENELDACLAATGNLTHPDARERKRERERERAETEEREKRE